MLTLLTGDCRELMATEGPFDLIVADPPYGETALGWDRKVVGWEAVALSRLKPTGSMWVFGSMRLFLASGVPTGFRYAQDIVWEKHNGTGFAKDRFKRAHEHAVQFYRADVAWESIYNDVQRVPGEVRPSAKIKDTPGPEHLGKIGNRSYEYTDTRIMKSVIRAPSVRGGIHRTAKPQMVLAPLILTSCPPGGLVGDFFAGSGSVAEACGVLGRRYVGCEIDPQMADAARAALGSSLWGVA